MLCCTLEGNCVLTHSYWRGVVHLRCDVWRTGPSVITEVCLLLHVHGGQLQADILAQAHLQLNNSLLNGCSALERSHEVQVNS